MTWSAGVSAAAAALAALFINGKTLLDHILFTVFTIIGVVALLIPPAGHRVWRRPRSTTASTDTDAREAVLLTGASELAEPRAEQVHPIYQMPVRWEVTDRGRQAMPSELGNVYSTAVQLSQFSGEFREFG